jgi:hypothetical protein
MLDDRQLVLEDPSTVPTLMRLLESRPSTTSTRRDYIACQLQLLDDLILTKGVAEFEVRSSIRQQADALRISLEMDGLRTRVDEILHIRALELLRDTGTEQPTQERMNRILAYSWAIVRFYYKQRDFLNVGKNLQVLANGYNIIGQKALAKRLTGHAWNILHERYNRSRDSNVITIVHKSGLWNLRLRMADTGFAVTQRTIDQIRNFADDLCTPAIQIETHRELMGHFGKVRPESDDALREQDQIERIRMEVHQLPPYGVPTFLRPEIERTLISGRKGDKEKGFHRIATEYLNAYEHDRHFYFYTVLKQWNDTYELGLAIKPPLYCTIMLVHMPRGVLKQ